MEQIAYTVTASFDRPGSVRAYIDWLSAGHVRSVCEAGAASAIVVAIDPAPGEPPTVQVRYLFPNRDALAGYLSEHAPRLRAEGLALFGPESGVVFSRSVGRVAHVEPIR